MRVQVSQSSMLLLVGLLGCHRSDDLKFNQSVTEVFEQVPTNEVDILWVVDDSVSMVEEQQRVHDGAADFITNLDVSGMDFHLGVITTDVEAEGASVLQGEPPYLTNADADYTEAFQERVAGVGTEGDQMESGYEAAINALTSPKIDNENAGFLREDATLAIIVLSDENDCSDFGAFEEDATGFNCDSPGAPLVPVADLLTMLRDAKGIDSHSSLLSLSGIIGPPAEEGCANAIPGERYAEGISLVGGVDANICATDYGDIMNDLGLVAAGLKSTFTLANVASEPSIQVTVTPAEGASYEVSSDATNGWTYEASPTSHLIFNGEGVPPRGSSFSVSYEVVSTGSIPSGASP